MLRLIAIATACVATFVSSAHAAGTVVPSKQFTAQKVYSDDLLVLNDFLEFSVFDMSKLGLFVNSKKVEFKPEQAQGTAAEPGNTAQTIASGAEPTPAVATAQPASNTKAEKEIRDILSEIPKFFYKNLKTQIHKNKVPVTLYAKDAPAYANPIQLYVKLKRISLAPTYVDKKGNTIQPVSVKIYGQLKEKKTDKLLTRFYDVESTEFIVGSDEVRMAFDAISDKMMQDLAVYLKTKY